ncbi:hypothetical protein [Oceanithermus sp.]|uniref:hypothetical protein n=1 Tax=Oceanithermus sp. TaxID=2268145 RepID=UPI0025F76CE8|nr:hypothetical protein [Oceanithermus sp.]
MANEKKSEKVKVVLGKDATAARLYFRGLVITKDAPVEVDAGDFARLAVDHGVVKYVEPKDKG